VQFPTDGILLVLQINESSLNLLCWCCNWIGHFEIHYSDVANELVTLKFIILMLQMNWSLWNSLFWCCKWIGQVLWNSLYLRCKWIGPFEIHFNNTRNH